MRGRTKGYVGFAGLGFAALCAWRVHAGASDASGFPDGYDAVQAAPDSPGGKSPHIRYHQPGGIVRDSPSSEVPSHAGHWSVHWMKPEPMHAIESVENNSKPGDLPLLRVEIKVGT